LQQQSITPASNPKVPLKTIDQLLIHNTDTAVKPIIGNKEIEKVMAEATYNASQLPFEAWAKEDIESKIEAPAIEGHLSEVYNSMAKAGTVNDKLNTLSYFESIILNSNVANRLINSAFMSLLMKLLKTVKSAHLKLRLCSIIGQLVRHSTVIGNQVAESGLCALLAEVSKDKNEKVRRKAVASLGEFLFYAATQLDDEQADQVWEIP
jgi:serine/threonine-protein kinase ULK4